MFRSVVLTAALLTCSTGCLGSNSNTPDSAGLHRKGSTVAVPPLTVRLDRYSQAQRTSSGLQSFQATLDERLQFVDVTVRNTSEEPIQLIARWTLIDEQDRIYKPTGGCMRATPSALTTLEPLQPERSRSGRLCFVVNKDATGIRLDVQGTADHEPVRFALD